MSKCNGNPVWPEDGCKPPWEQLTTFDPRPHHYNTLNLPTWDPADYPVLNQTKPNKQCDFIQRREEHGYLDELNYMRVNYRANLDRHLWAADKVLDFSHFNKYNTNRADLYYAGNALHWDNNNRGALNLYWDSNTIHDNGFQIGRSLYPSTQTHSRHIYDPARWMDGVYGIQFEWDSGRPFGAEGHDSDTTNPESKGYQLQDLVMTYVMMGSDGKVLGDFALTLVKDRDLMPGICYWWDGYSLWNSKETWDDGQLMEDTDPRRSGKCGFAIDCREPGFDLIRNCTWDGTKHGHRDEEKQLYLYSNNINHADQPDGGDSNDCTPATRCIWTSTYFGFHTVNDGTQKRKNFRMWNVKPITVPVRYRTDKRHDPSSTSEVGERDYYPYWHTDCTVMQDPTYGGPPNNGTFEQVLPAIFIQDQHPTNSYLKNGVVAKEMGLNSGAESISMPIMHDSSSDEEEPYGYERSGNVSGHLGLPPRDSAGEKLS